MRKRIVSGVMLTLFIVSILCSEFNIVGKSTASALSEEEFVNRHLLIKTGTYFELNNSEYLNVTITSTATVHIILSAPPKMIYYLIESADGSNSTTLALGNLQPFTTYYMYEDSYMNEIIFTTGSDGSYIYTQDLSELHHVFIQPRSGTTFICENTTLTHDIYGDVEICANNIALDLNGYSIIGTNTGCGVLCSKTNVTIKNGTIEGFMSGVYLGDGNTVHGVTIRNCFYGISMWYCSNNMISGNNIANSISCGICMVETSGNQICGNTISNNGDDGIFIVWSGGGNKIFHNNFFNNCPCQAESWWPSTPDVWDDGYPSGGNYWCDYKGGDLYSGPYQNVLGSDGIGDTAYQIPGIDPPGGQDRYPLMSPWTPPPQYYLSVQTSPAGVSTPSGEGWYDESTHVTLTAPSVTGYLFVYWDVDGTPVSGNPIGVLMDAPHTAIAHYWPELGFETFVTDSSFNVITKFDTVWTPKDLSKTTFKLASTNPGQFYFNIKITNTWLVNTGAITVSYAIGPDFILHGADPIQVWTSYGITGTRIPATVTYGASGTITISGIDPGQTLYITIHMQYGPAQGYFDKATMLAWKSLGHLTNTFTAGYTVTVPGPFPFIITRTSSTTITDPIVVLGLED